MRQPQVCKHQVCDHCGGRFGMVTHRWWGNKFCKRTCKDAYLHEVSLDRNIIRRWVSLPSRRILPNSSPRLTAFSDATTAVGLPSHFWLDHLCQLRCG